MQNSDRTIRGGVIISIALVWIFVLAGCASIPSQSDVVAFVEGEPVTQADLEYAIEIAHRREQLASTRAIHINELVDSLVGDRLIVQEARRMGLQNDPQIRNKVFAYHLREAVTRLYDEEILQKAVVSEADIEEYYKRNYEILKLGMIETDNQGKALRAQELLDRGASFGDVAREYSSHESHENGGLIMLERRTLSPELDTVVSGLNVDEVSGITQSGSNYYIIKFIGGSAAADEGIQKVRTEIHNLLKNAKAKRLGDEYIANLKNTYPPIVNQTLISSINLPMSGEERDDWLEDRRELARVGDSVLTAAELVKGLPSHSQDTSVLDTRIKQWIETKLVDLEALGRRYEEDAEFQEKVNRYADQLIKKEFADRYIKPKIKLTREDRLDYYNTHKEDFMKPALHRIQQITLRNLDEGREILNDINEGADFSWLARTKSIDRFGLKGGDFGWHTTVELPAPISNIIDSMRPGDISPIIEDGSLFRIYKLQDRIAEGAADFSSVERLVTQKLFREKYKELYSSYVDTLRKDAHIEIKTDAVQSMQRRFDRK